MKKMFDLPFWMIFHKGNINLEELPNIPDFENEISKLFAAEYLNLFKELAYTQNTNDEEQMKLLKPKISKLTTKLAKSTDKIRGVDMSKFSGWLINLSNV